MKIALLFLTRKDLNHPHLWQEAILEAEDRVNVYIHSKHPLEQDFFKTFRITQIVPTTYLIHVKAWQALLAEAIQNHENMKFVFLSESCIPLYSLKDIHYHLIQDDYSYLYYHEPWWDKNAPREIHEFPLEHRWGNSEWMILNRKHAELIVNDQEIIEVVSKHIHDQESYPSTLFSFKGILNEVVFKQTTYASFVKGRGTHPYEFQIDNAVNRQSMRSAKRAGCLFARKFASTFPEETLKIVRKTLLDPLPDSSNLNHQQDMDREHFTSLLNKLTFWEAQEEMAIANLCVILPRLIDHFHLEVGCEIGVFLGLHLKRILQQTAIRELYGIDPYIYEGFSTQELKLLALMIKEELERIAPHRVQLVQQKALEAVLEVPLSALDYLFIHSGRHQEPVISILDSWFSKVRKGGIICGYDSLSPLNPFLLSEIFSFFKARELTVLFDRIEPGFWWVHV